MPLYWELRGCDAQYFDAKVWRASDTEHARDYLLAYA
jgi:hypothetical protein